MKTFELTEEHLKLMRGMYFRYNDYCEFGAPEVDPKRPYGNSDVYSDIAEILGYDDWDNEQPCPALMRHFDKIHKECTIALQILVRNASIELGKYEADEYRQNWRKV